jgi:hypothetical protein
MSFHALNQHVALTAGGFFSPDAEARPLLVWLPETAEDLPETRDGYTLEIINGVTRGPAKNKVRDLMGNLVESERRFSVQLLLGDVPDGCPYLPIKDKTTFLIGHDHSTAEAVRIVEFDDLAGVLSLQVEKFEHEIPG